MIKIHCVDHNKLQKILRHVNTRLPTCLLRDLCPGQETTVKTRYRRTDGVKLRRKTRLYCHPIDLTYAKYILENAGLEETQAEIMRK